jgi:hypothetical protein
VKAEALSCVCVCSLLAGFIGSEGRVTCECTRGGIGSVSRMHRRKTVGISCAGPGLVVGFAESSKICKFCVCLKKMFVLVNLS